MSRCPPLLSPHTKLNPGMLSFTLMHVHISLQFFGINWKIWIHSEISPWTTLTKARDFPIIFVLWSVFFFFFLKWAEKFCILCLLSDSQAFKFFAYGLFFWCWKTFSYLNMKFFLKALVQCWYVEISAGYLSTVHKLF